MACLLCRSNCCAGKHLTEQLVADYHKECLPVAIVRPTLVCGLAGKPYPGYCGNLAGMCDSMRQWTHVHVAGP